MPDHLEKLAFIRFKTVVGSRLRICTTSKEQATDEVVPIPSTVHLLLIVRVHMVINWAGDTIFHPIFQLHLRILVQNRYLDIYSNRHLPISRVTPSTMRNVLFISIASLHCVCESRLALSKMARNSLYVSKVLLCSVLVVIIAGKLVSGHIESFKRQFVYRYGGKPYRPWRAMHEADNATFVDICLNATPAPPESVGASAEIMRNSSIDCQSFTNEWITLDIVTCHITYTLDTEGQESGVKIFYLCEGSTPDAIMVFTLAYNKVFIITKLQHEWPHDFTSTTLPTPTTSSCSTAQSEPAEPEYEVVQR